MFARDLDNPFFGLLGTSYVIVMIVFGVSGKKWLVADMLAHGYRERFARDDDEPI
jgi:hypothetical protein